MNVKDWWGSTTHAERTLVADEANTTVGYLAQLAGGHRRPRQSLAAALEAATKLHTPDRVICKVAAVFGDSSEVA